MYTCDEIENMQIRVKNASENEKANFINYVQSHTNLQDANDIMRAVSLAFDEGYEAFDRFDSDVCEQFITFFEKTFKDSEWVKDCEVGTKLNGEHVSFEKSAPEQEVNCRKRKGR